MKNFPFVTGFVIATSFITACNSGKTSNSATTGKDTATSSVAVTSSTNAATVKPGVDEKSAASAKVLVNDYLQLKNALTTDNANNAAVGGKTLVADLNKFDESKMTAAQKKSFEDIAVDAKEMAEHIGKSADRLPHQREHFDMLSQDMYDLVKLFGAGQPLYVDHCPMYNNNKGANWLSEVKEIKNPYLGTKMPTCGSIKEELK